MCAEFVVTRSSFLPSLLPWLRGLLADTAFADVTLACGDLVAPAHLVVLASSSRVFARMLRAAPASTHTVIHLQGVPPAVARGVLEYIYLGQTQVPEELLHTFLTTATDLQLEGLAGEDKEVKEKEEDKEQEVKIVNNGDNAMHCNVKVREFAENKGHSCNICGKVLIHRSSLKRHMETLHKEAENTVPITPLRLRGRSGVRRRKVVTKHLPESFAKQEVKKEVVEEGVPREVVEGVQKERQEGDLVVKGVEELQKEVVKDVEKEAAEAALVTEGEVPKIVQEVVEEEREEVVEVVKEEDEMARPRSKSSPGEPGTLTCPWCEHTVPTRRRYDLRRHMMRIHAAQYEQTIQ